MRLWCGDNARMLARLARGSVDVVLQDAPYGLTRPRRHRWGAGRDPLPSDGWQFSGRSWDLAPVVETSEWWATLLPALAYDGVVISFSAARTWHRQAAAMIDAGLHLHGVWAGTVANGRPATIDVRRELERIGGGLGAVDWSRYGTGLLQVWTPILVATQSPGSRPDLPTEAVIYHPRIQPSEQVILNGVKHPTQKPVGLLDRLLDLVGVAAGSLVVDPFAGTAATAVAAHRGRCRWVGAELCDGTGELPDYVSLAVEHALRHGIDLDVVR